MFDPRLMPSKKIDAIETVKMGTVDKIFLFYDDLSSFFPNVNAVHPIFVDDEEVTTDGNIAVGDDETKVATSPWHRKVFTFDRFYDNMLLVWITGWQAEYAEKLTDEEIGRTLTDLLRRTLNNSNVPEPKRVLK